MTEARTRPTGPRNATSRSSRPRSSLSLFEIYSGYVLTQGRDAMENIVLWEKLLRFVAIVIAVAVAGLWLLAGAEPSREILMMKAVLSALLMGVCAYLLWTARSRSQHEVRIDLIHRELSQVMRSRDGRERQLLKVRFEEIESLYIQRNRALTCASALFMRLRGEDEAVLLATGTCQALETVHARMASDLRTARARYNTPARRKPTVKGVTGLQAV